MRQADGFQLYHYLILNSWQFTESAVNADLVIIITCGYHTVLEEKSVYTADTLFEVAPASAVFVITGCLTKINSRVLPSRRPFHVVPPRALHQFDPIIDADIPYNDTCEPYTQYSFPGLLSIKKKVTFSRIISNFDYSHLKKISRLILTYFRNKKEKIAPVVNCRQTIRIGWGCLGACTYCAIKNANGSLTSKPYQKIRNEITSASKKGYTEFFFVSEDTGAWGKDIEQSFSFLFENVLRSEVIKKAYFGAINPQWFLENYDILETLSGAYAEKIPYLRFPLQSGSARILEAMRRPYCIESTVLHLKLFKKNIPRIPLHTEIIAGFPGETDDDHTRTKTVLRDVGFSVVSVYPFSTRPGTEAASLPDQIQPEIIRKRVKELEEIARKHAG